MDINVKECLDCPFTITICEYTSCSRTGDLVTKLTVNNNCPLKSGSIVVKQHSVSLAEETSAQHFNRFFNKARMLGDLKRKLNETED